MSPPVDSQCPASLVGAVPKSGIWRLTTLPRDLLHGLMGDTPARSESRDDMLQGDATLTYDPVSKNLAADFADIVNLDRNAAHTVETVRFDNLPVEGNGTFGFGNVDDQIRAAFGGSGHAETGGVFETLGIIGGFGATRQPSN